MKMYDLKITQEQHLGSGNQGHAFRVSIEGLPGKFVDKVTYTLSNDEMAKKDIK